MPHQCTNCDLAFEDGSKQMLGGCPECGGNKFQFLPKGSNGDSETPSSAERNGDAPEPQSVSATSVETANGPRTNDTTTNGTASGGSTSTIGAWPTEERASPDEDIIEAPAEPVETIADGEDQAQASARRDVVTEDELPATATPADDGLDEHAAGTEHTTGTSEEERADLSELREELNEQFESIKILRPGEYELNLMELYDRQEYIIALEEDGRYVIDVPDSWRDDD